VSYDGDGSGQTPVSKRDDGRPLIVRGSPKMTPHSPSRRFGVALTPVTNMMAATIFNENCETFDNSDTPPCAR
jgi:hypothetical protein